MGNEKTKSNLPNNTNFHILDYGYCKVWKRKYDEKELIEEYDVYIESQQRLHLYEKASQLRLNHPLFVNIYHFQPQQQQSTPHISCSTSTKYQLFTQRIHHRLSEFSNIKYPQIVKIIKTCIKGYKQLYEYFGTFVIRSTMIGLSQSYQIKLWIHTDFSQPQPQNPNCNKIQDMFASLINAVQSTCQMLYYNCPRFSQFIVKTNYVYFEGDFDTLMQGLNNYVQQLGIRVPDNLSNLKFYFKKPQGWEILKTKNNYPKLLSQQNLISLEISQLHSLIQKNIQVKTQSKNQIQFKSSKINTSLLTHSTNHLQTTNRIIQYSFPNNNQIVGKNQLLQINQSNQLSITSYTLPNDKSKDIPSIQKFHNLHCFKTSLIQQQKTFQNMKFGRILNKFDGGSAINYQGNSPKKPFQTKIQNYPTKSSDATSDSKNSEMSFKPQLSLIQALQTQAKKGTFQMLNYK